MNMLPDPVARYLKASAELDAEGALAPFAPDAVVVDEGRTREGAAEIADWIAQAAVAVKARPTVLSVDTEDGAHLVRASVSGDFPGSPVDLTFRFRLSADGISRLEIRP